MYKGIQDDVDDKYTNLKSFELDPEILEIKNKMLQKGITQLNALVDNENEHFYITTLVDGPLKEKITNLTLRRCSIYLYSMYPNLHFDYFEVTKCKNILKIILEKCTDYEWFNDNQLDVYWNQPFPKGDNYGTVQRLRNIILNNIFRAPTLCISCYDIDEQDNDDWIRGSPDYPEFTLLQLIKDETKYKIFENFWTKKAIGYQDMVNAIKDSWDVNFPNDIINIILSY